jgi:hypothetical protein
MNCSVQESDDNSYALFTNCMNPDNGNGLGEIYAYRKKIIVVASDGKREYNLIQ